jgi:hypothetical protein
VLKEDDQKAIVTLLSYMQLEFQLVHYFFGKCGFISSISMINLYVLLKSTVMLEDWPISHRSDFENRHPGDDLTQLSRFKKKFT